MAQYERYRDDPYPAPGASSPAGRPLRRLVRRWLVVAVVAMLGVAALYLWTQLFICELWGPLFHGRLPGAFGRLCR
jgi:hypothetical protein